MSNVAVRRPLASVLWILSHVDDVLFALAYGVWASIRHPEQPIYQKLVQLLASPEDPGWRARVLPRGGKYVVASDHHLLYSGAPHDYFSGHGRGVAFRNEGMYAAVMARYGAGGFTLVENGDVEDLVVTEPTHDGTKCLLSGAAGRLVFEADAGLRRSMRLHRLWRVTRSYMGYYRHLLGVFGPDRIVKLVGNHDVELLRPEFAEVVPLKVPIHEFAVIPAGPDGPAIVICHGHQMDPWTCTRTAAGIGESITESAAWLGQGADRIWLRSDWEPPLSHDNQPACAPWIAPGRLFPPKFRHMGERRLLKRLGKTFSADDRPWLVLGHTHEPRYRSADRYVNGGAVGRYQDLLWLVEIEAGRPQLVAWWVDPAGALVRAVLVEAPGDRLVAANPTVQGPLPPTPYAERPPLPEIDAQIPDVLPPTPWRWLVARAAFHAVFYAVALSLVWAACRWFVSR
ncbi:MAG: hypothetical protein ABMA64_21350 [Myxococcota bacterium]